MGVDHVSASRHRIDLDEIKRRLTDQLEELAEQLMGPPNRNTARRSEWRWGAKGSAALVMRDRGGRQRGAFFTHEGGQGGSPLDLIMHARGCQIGEGVRWARSFLRIEDGDTPAPANDAVLEERARKRRQREQEATEETQRKAGIARKLWDQAQPLAGTVAERYLVTVRGIPLPALGWPDCIRFHVPSRSLIVTATNAGGEVRAVQRVFLTPDARKIEQDELERRNLRAVKQTNGDATGAVVRLPARTLASDRAAAAPLLHAEGLETGLSAWVSSGHETWITIGSLRKIDGLPASRRHVICRDDDRRFSPADTVLRRLTAQWRGSGHSVMVATPWAARRHDKSDLNDVIREGGVRAVQARIERALQPRATAVERAPIGEVRRQLDGAVARFFDEASDWPPVPDRDGKDDQQPRYAFPDGEEDLPNQAGGLVLPPVHGIKVDVGVGKSRAAYRYAIRRLVEMRAAGDRRSIAVAVPTHKLGDEQALAFAAIAVEQGDGLVARVWRGMEAVDPSHSDAGDEAVPAATKTRMCRNLDAVRAAREVFTPVSKAACRQKAKDGEWLICPFFSSCGYQEQRSASADVWIVPHELLFRIKPSALGELAMLIVDEAAWSDGLEGVSGQPTTLALDELRKPDRVLDRHQNVNSMATDRLLYLRSLLLAGLDEQQDGPVLWDTLDRHDLDRVNAGEAYALEWRRFVDPEMHPRMTRQERKEAARRADGNARVVRIAGVWRRAQAMLQKGQQHGSGWLALDSMPDDEDGSVVRSLRLKWRAEIRKGWQVPTLILDATMNPDLLRPYWPQLELTAELLATAPHQQVRQVVDRAFSMSMLSPPADGDAAYGDRQIIDRRRRRLREVHAILMREGRRYAPERVLIVCQKAVKEALSGVGPIPPNIELAHHNAVAGRDEWGPQPDRPGVRALIVVGRTMPAPASVQRLAEALTGVAVEQLADGWYDRADAVRELEAGRGEAIESERHPDPIAEAIRWQICEGQLMQVIGRGRGVNRTAANPLDVLVLTDAPLPVPVTESLSYEDLKPAPDDLMMASGGVVFANARHASATYPNLWSTHMAAEHAIRRGVLHSCNRIDYSYRNGGLLGPKSWVAARADYRLVGAGQKTVTAWVDLAVVPDPEAFLVERLGPLATFSLTKPAEPEAPDAPSPSSEPAEELEPAVRHPRAADRWSPSAIEGIFTIRTKREPIIVHLIRLQGVPSPVPRTLEIARRPSDGIPVSALSVVSERRDPGPGL